MGWLCWGSSSGYCRRCRSRCRRSTRRKSSPGWATSRSTRNTTGVALLLLAGTLSWSKWLARPGLAGPLTAAVVALVMGHTYAANRALVRFYDQDRRVRENVEGALSAGLLDSVPDGATLLLDNPHALWHLDCKAFVYASWSRNYSEYFYYQHTGKKVHTFLRDSKTEPVPPENREVYEVRDILSSFRGGYVLLMHRDRLSSGLADGVRIYVRDDRSLPSLLVVGRRVSASGSEASEEVSFRVSDLEVVGRGPSGSVYALPMGYGLFLADSLKLIDSRGAGAKRT